MLYSLLVAPFPDSARQAQYEAVRTMLQAEGSSFPSVLVGNFEVSGEVVDALVVRPHSVTVLLFVPQGGLLDIPDQQSGAWQLGPYTLQGDEAAANPFEQFLHQQEALASWLGNQLGTRAIAPELLTGLVLFTGAVQFGVGVETYLRRQPGAENFQLLAELPQLPRRLRQLHNPEISIPEKSLVDWAQTLHTSTPPDAEENEREGTGNYWEQKVRRLWQWLGAEDIPHDAPYGSAAEAVAASQQEKLRLEQLSQQVRAELAQQRQEMEAREAERERSIEQLRTQLIQTPSATAEVAALQARLATETREKNLLEEAIRASQTESAVRNQELDARIQQLGQLIEQLQTAPAPPVPPVTAATAATPSPAPAPMRLVPSAPPEPARSTRTTPPPIPKAASSGNLVTRPSWRVQWPRAAVVLGLVLGVLGLVAWGLGRLSDRWQREPETTRTEKTSPRPEQQNASAAEPPSLIDIQPDTIVEVKEQVTSDTSLTITTDEEPVVQEQATIDSAQIMEPVLEPVEPE